MRNHLTALIVGFVLDLLLGDPRWIPHPVRMMGKLIAGLEKPLRRLFPKTPGGERAAGMVLVILVTGISAGAAWGLLALAGLVHPWAAFGVESILCYQCLAARSLRDESMKVYYALRTGTLAEARLAVSMIVGRDVDRLDGTGVAKAAVETVAENASDGVIAPLVFMALGGGVLGIAYKAVNTMDSMVGYRNEQYRYFGTCAARLDDVLNFIPARLSGVLLCTAAELIGMDGRNAWRIFRRDRRNHKSPNSAHTEAAAAGALGIELAGNNYYFGELVEKPVIGDGTRPVEPEDIVRVNRLMFAGALLGLALVLLCAVPVMLFYLLRMGGRF